MSEPAKRQNPLTVIGYLTAIVFAAIYFFTGRAIWNAPTGSIFGGALQIAAALMFFAGALLCFFTHPDVRKRISERWEMKYPLLFLLIAIAGLGLFGSALRAGFEDEQDSDAKAQGYVSAQEFGQARAAGFASANRYRAHLREVAEKARQTALKKAEEDAKYAAAEKLVVGRWLMPIDAQYMITIRHNGDGYEAETLWHNGDKGVHELRERKTERGERFDIVGDVAHTYYVMLANGELDIREKDGEFTHAVPFHGDARNLSDVDAALDQARDDLLAAQKEEACKKDIICIAQKYMGSVTEDCREPIEQQARWDFKWTDGLFGGSMFAPLALWHGKNGMTRHLVDFVGDKLKLENGFGAWQNYIYVCTIDVGDGHVVGVSLRPGRLPGGM